MSIQTWPFIINIYKGEHRVLMIPIVSHESGFLVDSEWFFSTQVAENAKEMGHGVISAINVIKESSCSTVSLRDGDHTWAWQKNSKYKTWISFWKHNNCARVKYYEDGHYEIYSLIKSVSHKGVYSEISKKIILTGEASEEEVGQALVEVFSALEEYYGQKKTDDYPPKTIELLDGSKLLITPPKDKHFQDDGDCSAAEIYQCYSYHSTEEAESSAEIFLGIAPELDCNLNTNNIRSSWEDIHGKADNFEVQEENCGIFILRAEMKNKEIHKISYFLQQEEDLLLECSMEVHNPKRRKKLDEKMIQMYEEFASGCKL